VYDHVRGSAHDGNNGGGGGGGDLRSSVHTSPSPLMSGGAADHVGPAHTDYDAGYRPTVMVLEPVPSPRLCVGWGEGLERLLLLRPYARTYTKFVRKPNI
jgi:hypothetical protein